MVASAVMLAEGWEVREVVQTVGHEVEGIDGVMEILDDANITL